MGAWQTVFRSPWFTVFLRCRRAIIDPGRSSR
jgi:hypothetical protein